jgi:hypothetical protein
MTIQFIRSRDGKLKFIKQRVMFDGATYVPERDNERMTGQILRIWDVMVNGEWYTLSEISTITGDPEASVSTRLRDFRKSKFGSHTVEKEHLGNGLYKYKLIVNEDKDGIDKCPECGAILKPQWSGRTCDNCGWWDCI